MAGLLSDACRRGGYATAWLHPRQPARVQGAVAAIYDGASLDDAGLAELRQLTAEVSPAPVLALLDAPRIQDVRLARTLGAAVLAKPFRVDELLWLLGKVEGHVTLCRRPILRISKNMSEQHKMASSLSVPSFFCRRTSAGSTSPFFPLK